MLKHILIINSEEKPVIQQIQQIVQAPAMSTKDSNLLKELGQKFPELEALIKKVQKDLNDHLLNYKTFSDDTTKKIQNNEENLKNYKTETNKKIAELEALFKSLRDQIANLNVSVTASKNTTTQVVRQNSNQGSSVDHSGDIRNINATLQTLIERINNLEKELLEIQNLKEKVNNLQDIAAENRQKISNLEEELFDVKSLKARVTSIYFLFLLTISRLKCLNNFSVKRNQRITKPRLQEEPHSKILHNMPLTMAALSSKSDRLLMKKSESLEMRSSPCLTN